MFTKDAYDILHKVTEKGFYVAGVNVCGFRVLLKTLTQSEDDMIRYQASRDNLALYRLYRLAYATFIVDGDSVLDKPIRPIQELIALYRALPAQVTEIVEELSIKLQNRYRKACDYLPGYTYSHKARALWKSRKGSPVLSTEYTGIPGSASIGIPTSVEAWSLVNQILDAEESHAKQLGYAMLVASASNPEGVKKMGKSLTTEAKMKSDERDALVEYGSMEERDRVLGIKAKESMTAPIMTSEDLVRELNRQMRGEKDKHDLLMEKLVATAKAEKEALEQKQLQDIAERRGYGVLDPVSGSFGVSDEDMKAMQSGEMNPFVEARKRFDSKENDPSIVHVKSTRVIGARHGRV